MNSDIDKFIQGQRDCREGIPAQSQDEAYISGYGFQYQISKTIGEKNDRQNTLQKSI